MYANSKNVQAKIVSTHSVVSARWCPGRRRPSPPTSATATAFHRRPMPSSAARPPRRGATGAPAAPARAPTRAAAATTTRRHRRQRQRQRQRQRHRQQRRQQNFDFFFFSQFLNVPKCKSPNRERTFPKVPQSDPWGDPSGYERNAHFCDSLAPVHVFCDVRETGPAGRGVGGKVNLPPFF